MVSEPYPADYNSTGWLLSGQGCAVDGTLLDDIYLVPTVVSPLCLHILPASGETTQRQGEARIQDCSDDRRIVLIATDDIWYLISGFEGIKNVTI